MNFLKRLYNQTAFSALEWFFKDDRPLVSDKGLEVLSNPKLMKKVMKAVKKRENGKFKEIIVKL